MVHASEVDDFVWPDNGQDIKKTGAVEKVGVHAGNSISLKKGTRFSYESCYGTPAFLRKVADHL